jgi:hypothetical protein
MYILPENIHKVIIIIIAVFFTCFPGTFHLEAMVNPTTQKVRGFKPGRGRWILRVIKSVARLPSEGK